ncbi:Gelsolin domain-containing protein [Cynara cardunculus var. scolymus]|uniref:Protein transport protein SEC23 n=1 Tax=Cynara cardunculus var. scolymus TaxID=59895 RepID=A0A103XBN4_CYNCS|nr:Gelsolin domain-containing protein [Cynara cardunculus var. scolymus]
MKFPYDVHISSGFVVFRTLVIVYFLQFQIIDLLGIHTSVRQHLGKPQGVQKHGFVLPVSECEFNITTAIEDIHESSPLTPGHRSPRCTGAAILVAVGLLEGCSTTTGSHIMVFTSGPATMGPGLVVSQDLNQSIRTHRDINTGHAPFYWKSCEFYKQISEKLTDLSMVLHLFACSLDQVGATEMRAAVERSGGFMMLAESFESDQFRKCLRHIFCRDKEGFLNMCFDATIKIITTKDVKICGAIGPCVSLRKKNGSVSDKEIGEGGTNIWKLGTMTDKMCIAFFFQVSEEQKAQPGTAFFIQFITKYRHGNMGIRKRVTSAARRWVSSGAPEIAAGFDQETAAAVMARLAVHETEKNFPREVVRWLDKELISFASKFGDYICEDPSSFRLSSNFSLYPQFMYHLRRSQFIDVFNSSPDETTFFQLTLTREGVVGSLIMIQPTLSQYSFDGPPIPVLLDVCSLSPDVILLFDSYFYVVIHYGSKIARWKKLGYDRDPNHENFRKLLEAPEVEAEQLVAQRIPVPKLVRCEQHGSQARFLLAKLNPSATHKSSYVDGSEVIMTDDVSLQAFIKHLQELAVQELETDAYPALDEFTSKMGRVWLNVGIFQPQLSLVRAASCGAASWFLGSPTIGSKISRASRASVMMVHGDENDVEELEMLLEAYFMQIDGTLNKLTSLREYIDDTEDYINIQLELFLSSGTVCMSIYSLVTGQVDDEPSVKPAPRVMWRS